MNILFVSDVSIHQVIGGAERVLHEQATRLAARGHRVHVLTRRLSEHQSDCETIGQVTEWRYPVDQRSASTFLWSTLRNGMKLFERIIRIHHFDCINFHQPFSAFAVLQSSSCSGIPKIYTCHSLTFEEYASRNPQPRSFLGKIRHVGHIALRRRIEKRALQRAGCIIALSQYTREKLSVNYGISAAAVRIIPGGIDLEYFHPAQDRRSVRKHLGLPQEAPLLLTVRNLVPRMGIDNLIAAMEDVVLSVPGVQLVIGGTGPMKANLEALRSRLKLERCVHFVGFIPDGDLPRYYQAADLFILPTIELEGFGMVTLEALASGTPVLGTPVGGTREILGRLDRGFLFEDTSPTAISRLIINECHRYQDRPEQRQHDSQRCRDFAERYYSWDVNVDSTERLFAQMIGDGRNTRHPATERD